jgi:hypothetical protein
MQMHMPGMGDENGGHGHHGHHRPPIVVMAILAFHCLFFAAATTCFLGAVNRAAGALKLTARVKALKDFPEAFTEDEREYLIEKVRDSTFGYY